MCAALCLLASLFFLWQLGGNLGAFVYRPGAEVSDLTITFWPNIHYVRETWRAQGQIPLWRTLAFCGSPFGADPQSGLWYPPNLVHALVPATVGFNLLFIAHTVWAGFGMWTWSRATGTSGTGSWLAALAYAFTPKIFAHLGFGHVGLIYAAAWVPWVLWAAYGLSRVGPHRVPALATALGLQFLAHPQLAFYTGLVGGVYVLVISRPPQEVVSVRPRAMPGLCALPRLTPRVSRLGWLMTSALLTFALVAVELLPLLRLAPLTARSSMDLAESAVSSLPPRYLWGLVLADHRGFMDYMLYVGLPVLSLALLALWKRRERNKAAPRELPALHVTTRELRFWWGFILLALIYTLGTNTPLYRWAFRLLPGLTWLRAPSRVWFVAVAALALMAGWGADRVAEGFDRRSRRWLNRVSVAIGGLGVALLTGYTLVIGSPPTNLVALGLLMPTTAVLSVVTAGGRLGRLTMTVAFTALLLSDLWLVDATLIAGRSPNEVFADDGLGAYLAGQQDEEPFRVYSPSYSLPRHVAARYHLETADGIDPLHLKTYSAWMEAASGVPRTGYTETVPSLEGGDEVGTANREATPNMRLLGLLNVRYLAAEFPVAADGLRPVRRFGTTYLYENEYVLPRAFVVGNVEPVADSKAALRWVQRHDVAQTAAVEKGRPLAAGDVTAEIAWVRRSPNQLVLDVALDRPGFLILSQVWYPSWRAEVDGERVEMWEADGVLSGLYLDAGAHAVTLSYFPRTLTYGAALSASGIIGLVALLGVSRRGRNQDQ